MQIRYILQVSNDIDSDSLINWFIAFSVCCALGLISNSYYTFLLKWFSPFIADGKSEKDDYPVAVVKGREAGSFSSVWWWQLVRVRPGEKEAFSCISFLCYLLQCHCPFLFPPCLWMLCYSFLLLHLPPTYLFWFCILSFHVPWSSFLC